MNKTFAAILTDRNLISLSGAEARGFLQGLITNDVSDCTEGRGLYAALLTPQGKILFDIFVVAESERLLLDCASAQAIDLIKRLNLYRLRTPVGIAIEAKLRVAAIWNENGNEVPLDPLPHIAQIPDPRMPALGARWIATPDDLPLAFEQMEFTVVPEDAYHRHRIGLAVPDSLDVPPDTVFALDAGFEELNGVSFSKGCFVGQEVTARMKHRATARRQFVVAESARVIAAGTPILAGDREIGLYSTGQGTRGLALVRLDRMAEAEQSGLTFTAAGERVTLSKPLR